MVVKVSYVSVHGLAMSFVRIAACGACFLTRRSALGVALQPSAVVTLALLERMVAGQLLRKGGVLKGLCLGNFLSHGACGNPAALYLGRGAQRVGIKFLRNKSVARQGT